MFGEQACLQTVETIEPVHNFISVCLKEQHKVNLYSRNVETMKWNEHTQEYQQQRDAGNESERKKCVVADGK